MVFRGAGEPFRFNWFRFSASADVKLLSDDKGGKE
jgi:hypothetical protein